MCAHSRSREIYVSEVNPIRATLAKRLGADSIFDPAEHNLAVELASRTGGEGPAVVYVCTGAAAALEGAFTLVRKGGQILVLGLGVEPMTADFLSVVLHELDILGSYLGYEEFPAALECVARGQVDVEALISHEIKLQNLVAQGFEFLEASDAGAVKVLVKLID